MRMHTHIYTCTCMERDWERREETERERHTHTHMGRERRGRERERDTHTHTHMLTPLLHILNAHLISRVSGFDSGAVSQSGLGGLHRWCQLELGGAVLKHQLVTGYT